MKTVINNFTLFPAQERQITAHSWGIASETFFGGDDEKTLGIGNLVQFTQTAFHPGYSNTGMKLLRNIELVDIVLKGRGGFQDSLGAVATYPQNTIQVISAGKGMYLSEFNATEQGVLEKLQIGFLPRSLNSNPIQTKALFDLDEHKNSFVTLISPHVDASSLSVKQHAAVLLGRFDEGQQVIYDISGTKTGLFLFVVDGIVTVSDKILHKSDGLSVYPAERIAVTFAKGSVLLLVEIEIENQENE
ncbi:MAG: pirin family protein [Ignavibacteriales bacterium]|nr:pirin family protein [Ignavibacteriales bacterium]